MSVLVTPSELIAERAAGQPLRVLDVRWRLDQPDGRDEYLGGHIPGAIFVDFDRQLARHGEPGDGRHPLPTVEVLQDAAQSWGISPGDRVVVYDDYSSMAAARAWWLLRYAGLTDVRVLDGTLTRWVAEGHDIETGESPTVDRGTVTLEYGSLPLLDIDGAAAFPEHGLLLDARAPERFRGDVEPYDPVGGHIPGAVNAPSSGNLDADGRFLPADALRERYEGLGVTADTAVATYCGSGVTAAHDVLALILAGFDAALYPGSWSQWSNTPGRPVATGE